MSSPRPPLLPSLFVLYFSLACGAELRAAEYSIIEIPPPLIHAVGLNNHGDVVGDTGVGTGPLNLAGAFVYHHHNGEVTQLPCQGTLCSATAAGIDDHGDVIGSNFSQTTRLTVIIWLSNGGVTLFENTFFSTGSGLNNHNQAVWTDNSVHGFLSGAVSDLLGQVQFGLTSLLQCTAPLCEAASSGAAINDLGHAVGSSSWGAEPPFEPGANQTVSGTHAVLWVNGSPKDLGALGDHTGSTANGVNNFDEVVGSSTVGGASRAFLYHKGKMSDLGNLPHEPQLSSDADGINDRGEIVGWSDVHLDADHSVTQRAFVMKNRQMENLTFLLDPDVWAKIRLTEATAINCHGWITANGYEAASGAKHAYLLLPREPYRKECPHGR